MSDVTTAKKPEHKSGLNKAIDAAKATQKPKAAKAAKPSTKDTVAAIKAAEKEKAAKAKAAADAKKKAEKDKADKLKAKEKEKAAVAKEKEKAAKEKAKAKVAAKAEKEAAKADKKESTALVVVTPEQLAVAISEADKIGEDLKGRLKRTVEDMVAIGQGLNKIKEILPHGHFVPYIERNFDLTHQSANNFMNVANRFSEDPQMLGFSPTILYELAQPSTPAEVIEAVKAKKASGEAVTVAEVKQMKQEAKPAKEVKVENADNSNYQAKQVSPGHPAEQKPEREPEPLTISFDESVISTDGDPNAAKRRAVQAVYDAVDAALIALQENQSLLTKDHFIANDEASQDMVIKMASSLQTWADFLNRSLNQTTAQDTVIQVDPVAV